MTDPENWQFRPAADLDLPFHERIRSIRREPSVYSSLFRYLWWAAVTVIMKVWHRFEVIGRDRLPKDLPFVLVANHSSHLDVVSLMLVVPRRWRDRVFPLAAADHFFGEIPIAAFTTLAINALPMDRQGGGKGRESLAFLRERLTAHACGVVMFPEGTRSRNGSMAPFKSGVGSLVAGSGIPVVPCHIEGAFAALPADRGFPHPSKVRVRIGEPVTFDGDPQDRDRARSIAVELENRVRALAAQQDQPKAGFTP